MSLSWNNVNIEVLNRNKSKNMKYLEIIKNCSGEVKHGEILAIMGPSGGGKTTLLNALAGRIPSGSLTQGEILYNEKPRCKEKWLKSIGFVDQDDVIHESLSVYNTLKFAAEFRLKNSILNSGEDDFNKNNYHQFINQRVNEVINDLKLNQCSQTEMSKISGGERKRAMIGIELITNPDAIFLDEPTSGLDTLTALKICKILEVLAKKYNKIVVLTIHQPSNEIFQIFDRIILLSNGVTVYNGNSHDIENYFTKLGIKKRDLITVPEFVVEICGEEFKDENPQFFYLEDSVFEAKEVFKDPAIRKKRNDFFIDYELNLRHVKLLLKRKIQIESERKFNLFKTFACKLLAYIFSAVFNYFTYKAVTNNPISFLGPQDTSIFSKLGSMIQNDPFIRKKAESIAKGMITSSVLTTTTMLHVSSTISSFFDENKLVSREIAVSSYSTSSYLISLLVYLIGLELLCPTIILIGYLYFLPEIVNHNFIMVLLLGPFFTVPFGLFIGSISKSKGIVIVLSSIFGTLSSIPPNIIAIAVKNYGYDWENSKLNVFGKLSGLSALIPTYYFTSFMLYLVHRNNLSEGESISNEMINQLSYICDKKMHILTLVMLMFTTPIAYLILAVYLLGMNLMPVIRMELQTNRRKKLN